MRSQNNFLLIISIVLQTLLTCTSAQLQLPSSFVQITDAGINLHFEFNDDNQTIIMGLDMNATVDYYAIGFASEGNTGMKIFDVVSFVFIPNTTTNEYTVQVSDLYSNAYSRPPDDVSLGGTSDYFLIDSYVVPGRSQVLFQRAYNTEDKFDFVMNPNITKNNIVINWAFNHINQYFITFHRGNAGTVMTPLYNGYTGSAQNYQKTFISPHLVICLHSYLMSLCWGILVEIAIQIGRYNKSLKYHLVAHVWLTFILYFLTALASGFALYVSKYYDFSLGLIFCLAWGEVAGTLPNVHMYMGYTIVAFCTLQVVFGGLFRIKMVDEKLTKALPQLSKLHLWLGLLIYLLTKAQIGIGLYLFKPAYMTYLYIYCGLIFAFRIFQEIWHRTRRGLTGKNMPTIIGSDSNKESHQTLMKLLNANTPIPEILKNPEIRNVNWAILDDKVFDLNGFTHPGGNFILNLIKGREIGRFIYGSYGLEVLNKETQHTHTKQALEIIQKNLIGTLQTDQYFLLPCIGEATEDLDLSSSKPEILRKFNPAFHTSASDGQNQGEFLPLLSKATGNWTLANKTSLTPLITKFEFSFKNFTVNPWVNDIRNLGRHFKVSHINHKNIRLYTLVLSQTEPRTKRRQLLWNKAYKTSEPIANLSNDARSDILPLIIKKYDVAGKNTFSSFVHASSLNTDGFKIEGPYGNGLYLTPESTGTHYIFAAGTGILPFIDLFDYLLEGVLDPISGNNIFKNGFKLHVFGSFGHINDFIGLEICEKLAKVCADKGMKDAFRMIVKAEGANINGLFEVTNDMFDDSFVQKHVKKECERVYVCGPPIFNLQVPASLEMIGLLKSQILFV